jgi:hypothetical protein
MENALEFILFIGAWVILMLFLMALADLGS